MRLYVFLILRKGILSEISKKTGIARICPSDLPVEVFDFQTFPGIVVVDCAEASA